MIDFEDTEIAFRGMDDDALRSAALVYRSMTSPVISNVGAGVARLGLSLGMPLVDRVLKKTVFALFCGGTTFEEAQQRAAQLACAGVSTILDYAVEGAHSDAGFDATLASLLRTIEAARNHASIRFVALKPSGLAPTEVLAKLHAGNALSSAEAVSWQRSNARFDAIAKAAAAANVPVFVDAEDSWLQAPVDTLCERLMQQYNTGSRPLIYTTVQLYLRNGLDTLQSLIAAADTGGYKLGVKLVRGAYLEKEREHAMALGQPSPVQPTKEATDAAFDAAIDCCLRKIDHTRHARHVWLCVATHNISSIEHLLQGMAAMGIGPNDDRVWIAQLLGMLDRLTMPLAAAGYNAAKYVPFGPIREVMPYLLRRADENKSVTAQAHGELAFLRREMRRRGLRCA